MFKRRDRRPVWRALGELVWPRGGWGRAFHYVRHRLRRLPDSPERIARGIWAGVLTSFTPFYGLHFFFAGFLAFVMRGNVLAALMATFFGNPLTYVPIGLIAMQTGNWLLGEPIESADKTSFGGAFVDAWRDLTHNFFAMFDEQTADWSGLQVFYDEVFFTYLVGGILPGIVTATVCYYLAVPVIRAYQKRRAGRMKAKLDAIRAKAVAKVVKPDQPGE